MCAKTRDDLLVCSGSLADDDGSWDLWFWQHASFLERASAAAELAMHAHRSGYSSKVGGSLDAEVSRIEDVKIDRSVIVSGSYSTG